MQANFQSSRLLSPVRPWFIFFSLFVALLLNLVPTGQWLLVPDWVALVLCFWSIREFRIVNTGWAFLFGLLMDVADGGFLGQHSFAYVVLVYTASSFSHRILWFPLLQQAFQILPLLLLCHTLQLFMRLLSGSNFPGWLYFSAPFFAALLWIPLTYLLLLPQYFLAEQNPERPI